MTAIAPHAPAAQAFDLDVYLGQLKVWLEAAMANLVAEGSAPDSLREAMVYSLMAGGKRLRSILVVAGAEAVGGRRDDVLEAAIALECVHTYSLIHDDLPAMDDDDLRRGKPTSHKVFGEAMAILAGDALLTRAFELLSSDALVGRVGAEAALSVTRAVSRASGAAGMVGGQVVDIESEGAPLDAQRLRHLHALKTGALIRVSVESGGRLAGATVDQLDALRTYGEALGLGFQIVDDILDVTATTAVLGKPQGSDARNGKGTYVDLLGLANARAEARRVLDGAREAARLLGPAAQPLAALADYVEHRAN